MKKQPKLTIFTPTYNRKIELKRLYNSLLKQTCKDFMWLVVDDGSTDNTVELLENIKKENKIKFKYIVQKNRGKYIAHNTGVRECATEYFLCVDSDDFLASNAVNRIIDIINSGKIDSADLIGFFFPRKYEDVDNKIMDRFSNKKLDIMDLKFNLDKNIECSIVIKTSFLKNKLFIELDEKFMSEEVLYTELAKDGKFLFLNMDNLYFSEYLETGLTKNISRLWKNNFDSTMILLKGRYFYLSKYSFLKRFKNRIKTIISLNAVCIANKKSIIKNTPSSIYSIMLFIPSIIWEKIKYED